MKLIILYTLLVATSAQALKRTKRDSIGQNRMLNNLSYHILHSKNPQNDENFIYSIISSQINNETSFEKNFKLIQNALKLAKSNRRRGMKRFGRRY
jgi:hypothetical protein